MFTDARVSTLVRCLFVAVLVVFAGPAAAGTIQGLVRDANGGPIPQAFVFVEGLHPPVGAQTDQAGMFVIRDVEPAPYLLHVKCFGYYDLVRSIQFEADGTARLEVALNKAPASEISEIPMERSSRHVSILRRPGNPPPELAESWPRGTTLDTTLPDAADSWGSQFSGATSSIDLAEFYVSDDPSARSSLTNLIDILIERAAHGVHIRLLVDDKFYKTYPGIVNQLDSLENVQSRRLDYGAIAGGILHAKYFVVDRETGYLGSQNFDWRALEHIQELGAMLSDPYAVSRMTEIFERDWYRGVPVDSTRIEADPTRERTQRGPEDRLPWATDAKDDTCRWQFVASPKDDLPAVVEWDLPRLVGMIDAAHDSIEVQLLTYKPKNRSGEMWDELDGALRRAAARGVRVKLLLANWGKRKGTVEYLQELSTMPGFELRFMNIPEASTGFIPFARTVHAKYMVVDGYSFWVGTSNWERDYFYNSRNVGIVGSGKLKANQLTSFFTTGWNSSYAERVQAGVTYTPPRIAE